MNILVVGGAGFIGTAVTKYIRSKGHIAHILDLNETHFRTLKDVRDMELLTTNLSFYDIVMVFAAVTSQLEFEKHPTESFATNVDGLFNVLEACRRSGVKKVVFASSAAVYGDVRARSSEEDLLMPNNMYATSKVIGEELFYAYVRKEYFKGLTLRYFNVYGLGENEKGDYKSIISLFLEQIKKNGEVVVYGDGEQRRDFINVKDAARITFELAMNHTGTFNVGTGNSISWNELLDWFETEGLKFTQKSIPNPIRDYQFFTEANIEKLRSVGLLSEIGIIEGIRELL